MLYDSSFLSRWHLKTCKYHKPYISHGKLGDLLLMIPKLNPTLYPIVVANWKHNDSITRMLINNNISGP